MTTTATPVDNGVDIEFLRSAREALTAEPEGAKFSWRVTNTWVRGTHSRSTCKSFYGLRHPLRVRPGAPAASGQRSAI